jgi:hypothetical protein
MQQLPLRLDSAEYWIVLSLAVIGALAAFYYAWRSWRRARIIEDAPTARVRSAPQGYVELEGEGRLMDGEPIIAPLTKHPCLWYRYSIERKEVYHTKNGTQTRWVVERQETSDNLFLLQDDTGRCVIDADGAEISTDEKLQWYGDTSWPQSAPLLGNGSALFSGGNYRYTEWLILEGQPLYALGQFKTISPAQLYSIADITRDLLREWKNDQTLLKKRFDTNDDGRIDHEEWALARKVARVHAQAEFRERAREPDINIMSKPEDDHFPYLLSIYPQDQLSRRYRLHAYLALAGFFVAGSIATWLLQFRLH